jgi:pyruvate/2-oxoglutarate dehydrogenase complex dihydrolipoamide acyltransferase (E2) component
VIPITIFPLCFGLGTVCKKPGVVRDRIEVREYLSLTAMADHDVIDGAPAARFLARLVEMLESGWGLT